VILPVPGPVFVPVAPGTFIAFPGARHRFVEGLTGGAAKQALL